MKLFYVIVCGVAAISLSGCGRINRGTAYITGHTEVCIDGIKYLQFPSGASVKVDKSTMQPETCS